MGTHNPSRDIQVLHSCQGMQQESPRLFPTSLLMQAAKNLIPALPLQQQQQQHCMMTCVVGCSVWYLSLDHDQEEAGYMPWSSGTEVWVGWCYPYPRSVQVLCIQGGIALVGLSELEMCYFLADVDDFIPVKCSFHPDAITGDLLVFVKESVVGVEWQLSCNSPSKQGGCSAKALLHHLRVNPAGLTTDLPLLQPVPLTLTLQGGEVRIHLLAETAHVPPEGNEVPIETRSQALGVVYATSCQAVYQQWPSTYAVAACTQLALHYMDDVSLTEEVLLEPAKVAVVMEGGPATPSQQQGVKETPEVQASALPLSMSQRQLSWPRPEPCPLGVCVQARCGEGPLLVRISQLSIDTLRRSLHVASQSITKSLAALPPEPSHAAPMQRPTIKQQQQHQHQLQQQPQQQHYQQQQQQQPQQHNGIVIKNRCPVDLICCQVGTAECLSLPAQASRPYCWHTPPGMSTTTPRLLCIAPAPASAAGLASTPLEPPLQEFGAAGSPPSSALTLYSPPHSPHLQPQDSATPSDIPSNQNLHRAAVSRSVMARQSLKPDSNLGSREGTAGAGTDWGWPLGSSLGSGSGLGSETHSQINAGASPAKGWSSGFDCMSSHCCQLRLELADGGGCTVAVSVHKAGLQWQVLLQPGFLLLNKAAGMVHVHHTGQLLACKGPGEQVSAGAEWQQQASEAGSYLALGPESKAGLEGNSVVELLLLTAKGSSRSMLQVWLGSSQGWSLPIPLTNPSPHVSPPTNLR
ncbi:Protein argonaute-3 [Trebouxia sp. C0009 RCD-2024]